MGYLNINKQTNETPLNEDFITLLHNYWTRSLAYGTHEFNLKKFNPLDIFAIMCYVPYLAYVPGAAFVAIAMLVLRMAIKWNFDILTFFDRKYFDSRFVINDKLKAKLLSWAKKHKNAKLDLTKERFRLNNDKMQKLNTHKATAKMYEGFTDTATTYYNIKDGNSLYVIFFTYDSEKIINAKVMTFDGMNAEVENIPEWKTVSPYDYRK